MSYNVIETSEYDSEPIELYTFVRQSTVFRYTSADEDKTFAGFLYESVPMERTSFNQELESAKQAITISSIKDLAVTQTFRSSPSSNVTTVNIQRYHEGDTEAVVLWLGRIINVKFSERKVAISCDPFFTSLKRSCLRLRYQTNCPHVLYSDSCGVARASFELNATLLGANGIQLISGDFTAFADGYFNGGYVEWDDSGITEQRFILAHVGDSIVINLPFPGIPGNADVKAFPGCDHTLAVCNVTFSNEDNYGGQPFYPEVNPMGGSPVF